MTESLEPEFQVVLSSLTWMLGKELGSSEKTSTLTSRAISQLHTLFEGQVQDNTLGFPECCRQALQLECGLTAGDECDYFSLRKAGIYPHPLYPETQQIRIKLNMLGRNADLSPTAIDTVMEMWSLSHTE